MSTTELLAECRARGIHMQARVGQLDIGAPSGVVTDELLQRLRSAKAELLMILAPPAAPDLNSRRVFPVAVEWPGAAADFCLLLTADDLPKVPFTLNRGAAVTDAAKFLRRLQQDISRGPGGPRAFYGALQADLLALQRLVLQAAENESANTCDGTNAKEGQKFHTCPTA